MEIWIPIVMLLCIGAITAGQVIGKEKTEDKKEMIDEMQVKLLNSLKS